MYRLSRSIALCFLIPFIPVPYLAQARGKIVIVGRNMAMKKTETQDTQLIRQLQAVYGESEMTRARLWWRNEFWPEIAPDYARVEMALGTRENSWLGQVVNYWGMAASLVLSGTLSERAFLDAGFTDEMFEMFCKVQPFLPELRRRMRKPRLLQDVEEVITKSKRGRQRLETLTMKRSVICRKDQVERQARTC
jgi:hypothetical protein